MLLRKDKVSQVEEMRRKDNVRFDWSFRQSRVFVDFVRFSCGRKTKLSSVVENGQSLA